MPRNRRVLAEKLVRSSSRHSSLPVSGSYPYAAFDPGLTQHRCAADRDDLRRRERLAEIAVRLDLPFGSTSLKSTERGVFHTVLPGLLVERDDVLHVAAVEVHDQQVAEDNRRRARAAEVIALEIAALPDHLAGLRVERRRAGRAERDVDPPGLDDRRSARRRC